MPIKFQKVSKAADSSPADILTAVCHRRRSFLVNFVKLRSYKKEIYPWTPKDDFAILIKGQQRTISRFLQVDTSGAFADFATRNNEDIFTILSADTSGRFFDFKRGEARTF